MNAQRRANLGYNIQNTINIGTISEITATLIIVETALNKIQKIAVIMNNHNERVIIMNKEEQDMELILKVYHEEEEKRKNNVFFDVFFGDHIFDILKINCFSGFRDGIFPKYAIFSKKSYSENQF